MRRLWSCERRWLLALFAVIFPSGASARLPKGAADLALDGFIDELLELAPLRVVIGLRAALWLVVIAPPFTIDTFRPWPALGAEDQLSVLETLAQSERYFIREIPLFFKMLVCLGVCGLPELHARLGIEPRDDTAPSWALEGRERER